MDYIRNTPKRAGSIGALSDADRPRPSTRRVSAGSMMPSSHSRAVAYQGLPWVSYCSRDGGLEGFLLFRRPVAATGLDAVAPDRGQHACGLLAPITLMRAFGHIHRKRAPYARPHIA